MGHRARFANFAVAQGHPRYLRMRSLESPCRTSYLSSIKTMALTCLVFEKKTLFCVRVDRQTDGQTDKRRASSPKAPHLRARAFLAFGCNQFSSNCCTGEVPAGLEHLTRVDKLLVRHHIGIVEGVEGEYLAICILLQLRVVEISSL